MLESKFKTELAKELAILFPGCIVLRNDPNYIQGFPDLLVLYGTYWASLECKRSEDEPFQPNQEYYIDLLGRMSFAAVIYPENKEEILNALQQAFGLSRPSRISRRK